jgi:uncharacterized protein with PIN domain
MKFLADEMCGDINRWLRILGYDTILPQDYLMEDGSIPNDDEIIDICLKTYRILISKDFEIIKKMKMKIKKKQEKDANFVANFGIERKQYEIEEIDPCLLLRSTDLMENLFKIYEHFNIELEYDIERVRCPKCNKLLEKVKHPELYKEEIPPSVYEYHSDYWICSNSECGQLFWQGTHLDRIKKTLNRIQKTIGKKY